MWALGVFAECLLILALFFEPYPAARQQGHPPSDSTVSLFGDPTDPRRQAMFNYLRDSLGVSVTASGDTLTSFSKDSFALTVLSQGDTVRDFDLSPAAERRVAGVVAPMTGVMKRMMPIIIGALALILLPIPLALTTVTLLWLRGRRGSIEEAKS